MKTLSFIILSLFAMNICINLSTTKGGPVQSSGTSRKNCCPFAKKRKAIVYYSVDNVANYFSINGVATYLSSVPDYANWPVTKVANVMLAPGDVFCLNGNNLPGGDEKYNPAAMIASIRYYDYNEKLAWLSTSSNWLCDGIKAKQFNNNADASSIWYQVKKDFMTNNIQSNAWWIWNNAPWSPNSYSTCCVTIPCCLKRSSYYFDDHYDC